MSFDNDNLTVTNDPSQPQVPPMAQQPQPVASAAPVSATPGQVQGSPAQSQPFTQPSPSDSRILSGQRSQDQVVSNTPAPNPPHPLVQKAMLTHSVARVLAGNPTRLVINDDGSTRREPVPLTGKQIGMAIVLEAISGSLTGLAAGRGRGPGAAGAAAFAQQQALVQQRQQQMDVAARQDYENKNKSLVVQAQLAEINSRIGLNTAEAEKNGSEMIDKAVEINRASGLLDVDPSELDNGGEPMTQAEIIDAMKTGRLNIGDHIGAMAGRVPVTRPDGTTHWEATFLVFNNPNEMVRISQDQYDRYVAAHIPGFPAANVGQNGLELKLSTVQRANEILISHSLADERLEDMRTVLAGTPYADKIPEKIDFSRPGVETALMRFQKYRSHSDQHGMDLYESLQAMGADRRDPKTGQMQPNSDAKYVNTVATAMGGWPLLKALHDKLVSDSAAQKASAEARARGDEEIRTARTMVPIKAATAGAEANARVAAENSPAAISGAAAKAGAEQTARNQADQAAMGQLTDPFGNQIAVTADGQRLGVKEYNSRADKFSKEYVQPLMVLQKTTMEFQRINSNPNQTGAEKVTALLNAVGISGDPLKGKGFRITNDIIKEHASSRNIWEGAVQKLNTVFGSGGPITSKQIADYTAVAEGVVHDAYVTAAQEALRQGLPVNFLPKATAQGQRADNLTIKIYLDSAGGDSQSAVKAMTAAGWK